MSTLRKRRSETLFGLSLSFAGLLASVAAVSSGCAADGDNRGPGGGSNNPGTDSHDGPEAFLPLYENGSRLRAVSVGAPGSTARRLVAWYDTELETECRFGMAEDWEMRCLPITTQLSPGFADAACTQQVFYDGLIAPCDQRSPFRAELVDVADCSTTRIVSLQRETINEVYHESCSDEPAELDSTATVWSDDEVIDPGRFVKATTRERANTRGVGVVELLAEDGAREVTSILDRTHGACGAREVKDGGVRCLPHSAFVETWWFADAACDSSPLAYGRRLDACFSAPAAVALDVRESAPGGIPEVVSLGSPMQGSVYELEFVSKECSERNASELLWTLYPVTGSFDVNELVALEPAPHGNDRVRTYHHTADGVVLSSVAGPNGATLLFDAERNAPCVATRHVDGSWLCLPENFALAEQLYYADEACAEPLVAHAGDEPPELLAKVERNHCVREGFSDSVSQLYTLGASHGGGAIYFSPGDETCILYEEAPSSVYYSVSVASADAFPALDEKRE